MTATGVGDISAGACGGDVCTSFGIGCLLQGDWRGISRQFVTSRTPTQVASHAQKFFMRRLNYSSRKRRSSVFDLAPEPEVTPACVLSLRRLIFSVEASALCCTMLSGLRLLHCLRRLALSPRLNTQGPTGLALPNPQFGQQNANDLISGLTTAAQAAEPPRDQGDLTSLFLL